MNNYSTQLLKTIVKLFLMLSILQKEEVMDVLFVWKEMGPGFQGIRQYVGPVYGDGNSYNLPTQDLYDAFASFDGRRDVTVLDLDAFIAEQDNLTDYLCDWGWWPYRILQQQIHQASR